MILEVYDVSREHRPALPEKESAPPSLLVATHSDLVDDARASSAPGSVTVDALRGAGRDEMLARIAELLGAPGVSPLESVALATERHRASAWSARTALLEAATVAESRGEAELVAVHLRDAVDSVRSLLGEVGPEDLLGRIFSRFCVGK